MVSLNPPMMLASLSLPLQLAACFGLALLLCALILGVLLRSGLALRLATDVPNHRSLHVTPTPRVGGWGIVPASLLLILLAAPQLAWLCAGAAVLAAMSHLDDRQGLSARVRFAVHFLVAAALVVLFAPPVTPRVWQLVLMGGLVFGLVWLINLYNFMDGADGLAGGMACCGFLAYALAAGTDPQLACAAIIVSGAAAGFLCFNFHPARIFLGDAGSIPLGFLAGALGYWGWRGAVWPGWFPVLVFAPFIADATVTLLRRLARGEKFWQAHRQHYYQRMVQMGAGHARTALSWYVVMLLGAALGLWALHLPPLGQGLVCAGWAVVLCLCAWRIDSLWDHFNQVKASH